MPVVITLGSEQLLAAQEEARRRQKHNEARGLKGRNRAPARGAKALEMHRLGCIGEMAVAMHLELKSGLYDAKTPVRGSTDLPGGIEVKTRSKHHYDLLVQLDDDPNKIFVLATHEGGETTHIVGWINGKDAMRKEWIREFVRGRPCYAVPQSALNSMATLEVDEPQNRLLEAHEAWLSEEPGAVAGETDLVLHFSEQLADRLGWYPGDSLTWDVDQASGTCRIYKSHERTQKGPGGDGQRVDGDAQDLQRNEEQPDCSDS